MIRKTTPERLSFFSDAIFAVLITVLVLELRPPERPTFEALLERWPTWLSYAVSYLFIAIVWANHHYLLRYAREATPRLMWFNFAHLFSVSLLPLSTAWMAVSRLSPQPVAFYAAVFFFVNVTYILLIWGTDRAPRRRCFESPPEHAISLDRDFVPFRNRLARRLEISLPRSWNLLFLPGGLSEARCARRKLIAMRPGAKNQRPV
jgi:uncharacterized membrane protein